MFKGSRGGREKRWWLQEVGRKFKPILTVGLIILSFFKMQIEMEIPHILQDVPSVRQDLQGSKYKQEGYRWVIVALMGLSLLLNGIANNAIIPLQHKMTTLYGLSEFKVSISIMLSFLIFSLCNFPANHIIDSRGLRLSFLLGTGFYSLGLLFYTLINSSYYFVILGTACLGIGQPFLLNCPAKVAAFWFFPKNRAFATAVMVGINLFGMGVGFLIPTLVIHQQATGDVAKKQIKRLYLGYFVLAAICFILNLLFMRARPSQPPSEGAEAQKLSSPLQSLKHVRADSNLWKFFLAYFLTYGTFIAFASNCNFIIKPYGYSDVQIAGNAVLLMVVGTIGAIGFSLYIKKTFNYSGAVKAIALGSPIMLALLCTWLNTANLKIGTTLLTSLMGFILTPVVPLSYDLGCELAFPMGEAQVTGLLNGGAMLWAFTSSSLVTATVGFGTTHKSFLTMAILFVFIMGGAFLFFSVKMDLKRQEYEKRSKSQKVNELSDSPTKQDSQTDQEQKKETFNYVNLIEERAEDLTDGIDPPYPNFI